MKVIDLLNKIANGEEDLPNIIIVGVEEDKHYYNKDLKEYINQRTGEKLFEDGYGKFLKYYLNEEVEIIEEDKKIEKKIEKLDCDIDFDDNVSINGKCLYDNALLEIGNKINEIIDYLNKENK